MAIPNEEFEDQIWTVEVTLGKVCDFLSEGALKMIKSLLS